MKIQTRGTPRVSKIFEFCEQAQSLAISEKIKVGAVVIGIKPDSGEFGYFAGANMETSISFTTHGEVIALQDCLMHRYYPIEIYVTSMSDSENVFLCGTCRQQFLEVNENCMVSVFNPDGTVKNSHKLRDLIPFHKNVAKKNTKFLEMCKTPKPMEVIE